MTDTAPAVQVVDLTVDDEPTKPELSNATTYCCGRHHCCCGRCRFACNPKRKKICVALAVVLAAAAAAIIICAVYFTWPKPGTAIRVQHVVGSPSSISTLTTAAVGGRRLLQQQSTVLLSPHSAVQSATNNAYAQVRSEHMRLVNGGAHLRFDSALATGGRAHVERRLHSLRFSLWRWSRPCLYELGAVADVRSRDRLSSPSLTLLSSAQLRSPLRIKHGSPDCYRAEHGPRPVLCS